MSNLIPSKDRLTLTGALYDHWDTFKFPIVIFKEPIQIINDVTDNVYPGYSQSTTESNVTFVAVSGVYSGIKVSDKANSVDKVLPHTTQMIYGENIRIKVREDAKTFITQGKTEGISVNGCYYNVISQPIPQNYLGLVFYYFDLSRTQ